VTTDTYRHLADQVAGLASVAGVVAGAHCPCFILIDPTDVAALQSVVGAKHQVTYASDGYDVWTKPEPGHLGRMAILGVDVSAEVAAQYVIDDFMQAATHD